MDNGECSVHWIHHDGGHKIVSLVACGEVVPIIKNVFRSGTEDCLSLCIVRSVLSKGHVYKCTSCTLF